MKLQFPQFEKPIEVKTIKTRLIADVLFVESEQAVYFDDLELSDEVKAAIDEAVNKKLKEYEH